MNWKDVIVRALKTAGQVGVGEGFSHQFSDGDQLVAFVATVAAAFLNNVALQIRARKIRSAGGGDDHAVTAE